MTSRDVSIVVYVHLRALQISDPYTEDFYFHNLTLRRRGSVGTVDDPVTIPLPVWEETKQRALAEKKELRAMFASRTKEWEAANKVLGHVDKSNPHRQRALLAGLDSLSATKTGPQEGADGQSGVVGPFSSPTWEARRAIEEAKAALLDIDEQRRLLQRDDRTPEQLARIQTAMATRFHDLQAALGFSMENADVVENEPRMMSIADIPKGRKLIARVLKLMPSQAPRALPIILRALFAQIPLKADELSRIADPEELRRVKLLEESEADLLTVVQELIRTSDTMKHATFRACIENIIGPHIRNETLNAALSVRHRAEFMTQLLKRGSETAKDGDPAYWKTLKAAFMDLAMRTPGAQSSSE